MVRTWKNNGLGEALIRVDDTIDDEVFPSILFVVTGNHAMTRVDIVVLLVRDKTLGDILVN